MKRGDYFTEYFRPLDGKNIEDDKNRYNENQYSFSDEITNISKNQKLGNIK